LQWNNRTREESPQVSGWSLIYIQIILQCNRESQLASSLSILPESILLLSKFPYQFDIHQ
jgi:hypothetical protein